MLENSRNLDTHVRPGEVAKFCSDLAQMWPVGSIAPPKAPRGSNKVPLMFTKFGGNIVLIFRTGDILFF